MDAKHPLMVSEASYNTTELRAKYAELLFEKFETPALFLCKDAVLSAFSAGRSTALVLDLGGGIFLFSMFCYLCMCVCRCGCVLCISLSLSEYLL